MTTKKTTPANAKAPETRDEGTDEPVTKLAQVENPAKITAAKIDEIAGEHSDPSDPEQTANVDVADTLKQNKADAKAAAKGEEPEKPYFGGQGGATGL